MRDEAPEEPSQQPQVHEGFPQLRLVPAPLLARFRRTLQGLIRSLVGRGIDSLQMLEKNYGVCNRPWGTEGMGRGGPSFTSRTSTTKYSVSPKQVDGMNLCCW